MTFFIQLKQTLPGKLQELSTMESTETKTYINSTINKQKKNMHKISDGFYVIGKMSLHVLTANELTIVCPEGLPLQNFEVHKCKEHLYITRYYAVQSILELLQEISYFSMLRISCPQNQHVCRHANIC